MYALVMFERLFFFLACWIVTRNMWSSLFLTLSSILLESPDLSAVTLSLFLGCQYTNSKQEDLFLPIPFKVDNLNCGRFDLSWRGSRPEAILSMPLRGGRPFSGPPRSALKGPIFGSPYLGCNCQLSFELRFRSNLLPSAVNSIEPFRLLLSYLI